MTEPPFTCDLRLNFQFGTPEHPSNRLEKLFWAFHAANPIVYMLFCRFTDRAIRSGYPHFSVSMIIERIRWETNVETYDPAGGDVLKINNNYSAYYARLWMRDHPGWPNFFRTRAVIAERLQ
jgi:hypothetical protein